MLVTDKTPLPGALSLTDREMTTLCLMGAGHSSPEIAAMLQLSPRTVENRKRLIYDKLGVSSQGQAVAEAVRLGLLRSGRPTPRQGPGERPLQADRGHTMLVVLMGPAGPPRDQMIKLLISERVPLVTVLKRESLLSNHWLLVQRGLVVVVLVDPEPEDWRAAGSLLAPALVVSSRDLPGRLAIASAIAGKAGGLVAEADVVASSLRTILAAVGQGLVVMSSCYAGALRKWAPPPSPAVPQLTAREREILGLIACGHSVRQTARALGIATKTVENIQARLFRKLGARNRMDVLTIADGWGLVESGAYSRLASIAQSAQYPSRTSIPAQHDGERRRL
jgi:two-component system nitrate/nitrite response regulator NarL